jgi:hypothetical protein
MGVHALLSDLAQRLADLFVPLFRLGTATPQTLIDGATKALSSTETFLSLGLVALVLTLSLRGKSNWHRSLSHLLVFLPFIGSTLGVITLSEAYGVLALEVVVWLGGIAAHLIWTNIMGFLGKYEDETIGAKLARLALSPVIFAMFTCLVFAAFFSSTMVGGMADFALRYGSDEAPRTTAANFRAHHDQMMRIEHRCLGLPKASEEALKSSAEKNLAQSKTKDFHGALKGFWQNHIIWGDCSASKRSSAPSFMLLCLLGLLLTSLFHPGFDKNSTPNGLAAAVIGLSSMRLIFLAMAPFYLTPLIGGVAHIGFAVMLVLAVQRGVSGVLMPSEPIPEEPQRWVPD